MKKIVFFIVCFAFFSACNNDKTGSSTKMANEAKDDYVDVVVEEEIDELPNESDLDFEEAFDAFEDGDYDVAVAYINAAIDDLRAESKVLDKAGKAKVEASIKKLQQLNGEIEAAEKATESTVKNSDDLADKLANAFAEAEMTVAHEYFVFSNIYVVEEPVKAKGYFASALTKMENATSKLKGTAKADAAKILAESKELIDEEGAFVQKKGAKVGSAMDTQLDKIGAWLRKHTN